MQQNYNIITGVTATRIDAEPFIQIQTRGDPTVKQFVQDCKEGFAGTSRVNQKNSFPKVEKY